MTTDVVVGASAGLGAALALELATRGRRVIAVARRPARLADLVQIHRGIEPIVGDICRPIELTQRIVEHHIMPQARWWLCAGWRPLETTAHEHLHNHAGGWIALLEQLLIARLLLESTRVVYISSAAAWAPFDGLEAYCASKAAVEAWIRACRHSGRFAGRIVRPGQFDSEFYEQLPNLRNSKIPMTLAQTVIRRIDSGSGDITLGGWRDIIGFKLSSLIGHERARLILDLGVSKPSLNVSRRAHE